MGKAPATIRFLVTRRVRHVTTGNDWRIAEDSTAGAGPGKGCRKARESMGDLPNGDVNADNRRVGVLFMYSDKTSRPAKSVYSGLSTALTLANSAATAWHTYGPIIAAYFNIK